MKTLTARSLDESPSPALTWTEHALVEFELSMSGRSAVRNAVLRNGEGYMRQIATLPAVIAPPVAPRPAPRPRRQQVWLEALAMVVITIAWIWALVWVVNVVAGRG